MARIRLALVSLAALPISLTGAAAALALGGPGLTKTERKAVDIVSVDAATTPSAALVEIGFKGKIEDELGTGGLKKARVTINLETASGPPTVITDRGRSERPREGRNGTQGRFDVIRDGRGMLLLVEALPAHVRRLTVTTSGPGAPARARGESLGGFDEEEEVLDDEPPTCEELKWDLDEANEVLGSLEDQLEEAERMTDDLLDRLHRAQRDLSRAQSGEEATAARKEIDRLKKKLEENVAQRKRLRDMIKAQRRWIKELKKAIDSCGAQPPPATAQCSDGIDNPDPEDTIVDFPTDPGCLEPADNDEKDNKLSFSCPPDSATAAAFIDVNTPATNSIVGHALSRASDGMVLHTENTSGHTGTVDLGTSVCGAGITVTLEDGACANAPSGPGVGGTLPPITPPAGDTTFRFALRASNPAGGAAGGQTVDINGAIDTRAAG